MSTQVVELRKVTKKIRSKTIIDDISFNVYTGEVFGFLGPNGAGKSTLMRILATLQQPDQGSIYLNDINLLEDKLTVRRTLGYLPQDFGLVSNTRAVDLLDYFAILKGITHKKERASLIDHLLQQTNLWEKRKTKVGGFSGGMKQRFGEARALIANAKLLIVDEPTAGLDPSERLKFLNILSELGQNSIIILSTHIVADVSELCNKMAIINRGEILMEGSPSASINNLKGKIWRRIIDKNELTKFKLEYEVISTKLIRGETMIHVFCNSHPGNNFEPVSPDLEDVYFNVLSNAAANPISN